MCVLIYCCISPGFRVSAAVPDATPVDVLLTFESGTVGAIVTPEMLDSFTFGTDRGTWGSLSPSITHTKVSDRNFLRRTPLICNGVIYDGTGTSGLVIDHQAAADNGLEYDSVMWLPPASATGNFSLTALMKFKALPNPSGDGRDLAMDYFQIAGGAYSVMQCFRGACSMV